MTIAQDGVIWTIGWDQRDDGKRIFNVLKRFNASGELLSTASLSVKTILGDASHGSELRSSKDRVGWLTGASEYLEFSLDGREIGRFPEPPWRSTKPIDAGLVAFINLALSDNNEVVVAGIGPLSSMWLLDRVAREWRAIFLRGEQLDKSAWLLGFDGNELIVDTKTSNRGEVIARLVFSSAN